MAEIKDIENLEVIDTQQLDLELARFRSGYYRDKFRLLAKVTFFLVIINVALVGVVFYLYWTQPKVPQEFYTSNLYNGDNTSIYPLDHPMVKPKKLIDWAQKAMLESFTFNFVNYNEALEEVKKYYTVKGWNELNNSLSKSGLLGNITKNKFFLATMAENNAKILDDGVVNGHHAWRVRMPVILTFKTSENATNSQLQQKAVIDAIITRIPDIDNPESIGIDSINISWEK